MICYFTFRYTVVHDIIYFRLKYFTMTSSCSSLIVCIHIVISSVHYSFYLLFFFSNTLFICTFVYSVYTSCLNTTPHVHFVPIFSVFFIFRSQQSYLYTLFILHSMSLPVFLFYLWKTTSLLSPQLTINQNTLFLLFSSKKKHCGLTVTFHHTILTQYFRNIYLSFSYRFWITMCFHFTVVLCVVRSTHIYQRFTTTTPLYFKLSTSFW